MPTLYDQARDFAVRYPTDGERAWTSGQLLTRFNNHRNGYITPNIARLTSKIASHDPDVAPVGAYHFWAHRATGVAGQDLIGAGKLILTADPGVSNLWGEGMGVIAAKLMTIDRSSYRYKGWALDYGGNTPRLASDLGVYPTVPAEYHYYDPPKAIAVRIQKALSTLGLLYETPDGIFTRYTRMAIQIALRNTVGYPYKIDGHLDGEACRYIQDFARRYGSFTGPIDLDLNNSAWVCLMIGLERTAETNARR